MWMILHFVLFVVIYKVAKKIWRKEIINLMRLIREVGWIIKAFGILIINFYLEILIIDFLINIMMQFRLLSNTKKKRSFLKRKKF